MEDRDRCRDCGGELPPCARWVVPGLPAAGRTGRRRPTEGDHDWHDVPDKTVAWTSSPSWAATQSKARWRGWPRPLRASRECTCGDTEPVTGPGPMVRPSSAEMPGPTDRSCRLQLLGEVARGGMGAILKGRDTDLGRDLAIKVLLEQHRDNPDLIRRFIEEAQIAGQLQHPGVVPVYELGALADHRPYFAMKLVKGRTLAALLDERRVRRRTGPGCSASSSRSA